MFTGIIAQLGVIKAIRHQKNLIVMDVDTGALAKEIKKGDSVAINGVCLTATSKKTKIVSFDMMRETIEKTSLGHLKVGSGVNLELALRAGDRLGGHFVTGHVDEMGTITAIEREPNWVAMTIKVSKDAMRHLAPKASVTMDGISLTIGRVHKNVFSVYLIPYTLKVTNLSAKKVGDPINIETDVLAKYVLNVSI